MPHGAASARAAAPRSGNATSASLSRSATHSSRVAASQITHGGAGAARPIDSSSRILSSPPISEGELVNRYATSRSMPGCASRPSSVAAKAASSNTAGPRSIGFDADRNDGSRAPSRSAAAGSSGGSARPSRSAWSAHSAHAPPEMLANATRGARAGGGAADRAFSAHRNALASSHSATPSWRHSARNASPSPASDAVCDATAPAPRTDSPERRIATRWPASRQRATARANRGPSSRPSM